MKFGRCFLLFSFFITASLSVWSQKRIYVNEYLNIGVGARGLSMGGAQVASANDAFSPYWNPAGMIDNDAHYQLGLMHAEYFSGIFKYDYGSVIMPFDEGKRSIGVSLIRFATDNIPYTIDYLRPDGSFDESMLRSISAGDYAMTFSYAQKLNLMPGNKDWTFDAGANLKVLYRHIGSMGKAWGIGVDVGMIAQYKQWNFGVFAKDITTTNTAWSFNLTEKEKEVFRATGNEIPIKSYETMLPRLNLGAGYQFVSKEKDYSIYAEFNADITTDGRRNTVIQTQQVSIDPKLGLELGYKNMIFLRAGVQNFQRVSDDSDSTNVKKFTVFQPSIGVGLNLKGLEVDYAFTSLQMQDNPLMSHIVSLKIDINIKKRLEKNNDPQEILD